MADLDEDARGQRQRNLQAVEDGQEARQREGHEKDHDAHADGGDHGRVNEGRLELRLHFGKAVEVIGQAAEHVNERTGLFARAHHVDVEV